MRACVVGAGPAGIVSAKVLLEDGFNVTVFD
ncbi:MAG: NAD(P)-binding protein, partial [Actinobacteria bacterium]|nr:NAD(P)-binding protein [Actinomycetota bacterium]